MTDCFWHGKEELSYNLYKWCFECGHVWPTEEDFIKDVNTMADEVGINVEPLLIKFCPLCAHDF